MEHNWGASDVLAVTKGGMVIETEVKVTLQDLKRDKKKPKHSVMAAPDDKHGAIWPYSGVTRLPRCHYFYFAVPSEMETRALQILGQMYPYAGLLVVRPNDFYQWDNYHHIVSPVSVVRKAHRFTKPKLSEDETMDIIKGLSVTACQMAFDLLARDR